MAEPFRNTPGTFVRRRCRTPGSTNTALAASIRNTAPGLADLLAGANAAIAVAALGRSLLGDVQAGAAEVAAAVAKNTPQTRLAVLAAEQSFRLRLRENNVPIASLSAQTVQSVLDSAAKSEALAFADTDKARQRQIESHDNTNAWLAYIVTAGFFLIIGILIFAGNVVDYGAKNILYTLLGVVGTGWANIIGFYFGSSAGSQQKSATISAALLRPAAKAGG
jgi:hypothetical protein